ncbi:unnamed protein product [Coffea canephora]|uniref:Protein kinase domain-containing protein n=1 Tax=Coffea canephora TaxID=49390 RepID=A0A068V898_COFCA|nr:unnamed protein product [Coffea canephora]
MSFILLKNKFISDFRLAKWLPSQWTHHSIVPIEGTFGHLAPEYFMHGVVDEKTDVFAFGVFLLELLSDKKPAKPILSRWEIEKVVDPRFGGFYDIKQLNRPAFAASLCIPGSSIWCPTISEVLLFPFNYYNYCIISQPKTRSSHATIPAHLLPLNFSSILFKYACLILDKV